MTLKTISNGNKSAVLPGKKRPVFWHRPRSWESKSMTEDESDTDSSDVECPTCGRTDFESTKGMKSHHKMTHGESIAGFHKNCEWCDESFIADQSGRQFCSRECKDEHQSEYYHGENHHQWKENVELVCECCGEGYGVNPSIADRSRFCSKGCRSEWLAENHAGENHPMWGGRIEKVCKWCGGKFAVEPHRSDALFCGTECHGKWRSDNKSGENHPQWKGGKIKLVCEWCGDGFEQWPNKSHRRFCSRGCWGEWKSENRSGENSKLWEPGYDGGYGSNWITQREIAIARDSGKCRNCGVNREDHYDSYGRDLHVHHIIPSRMFDSHEAANEDDNLITLCVDCHNSVEQMAPLLPENIG